MMKGFDLELLNANKEAHPETYNAVYDRCVEDEVEKKYSVKRELSIHRQKDRKPAEYAKYDAYVEECKRKVKVVFGIEEVNDEIPT